MYLHYTQDDGALEQMRARLSHKARVEELRIDEDEKRAACYRRNGRDIPYRITQELRSARSRCNRCGDVIDKIYEEQYWREDKAGLVADYTKSGYALKYICISGNAEYDTEEEALSEARFQHVYNGVLLDFGPDGAGCDDMLDPQDMVQAVFVRTID